MYMFPYRCRVVGHTGNAAVSPGAPPAWCEDDTKKCISGPKQVRRLLRSLVTNIRLTRDISMARWSSITNSRGTTFRFQAMTFLATRGHRHITRRWGSQAVSWYYSLKDLLLLNMIILSYKLGAQTDIFHTPGSATPTYVKPAPTPTLKSSGRADTTPVGMVIWVVPLSMALGLARIWIWSIHD